jgi:hypothetical protein
LAELPWWAAIIGVYVLARGSTTLMFWSASALSGPGSHLGLHPTILRYLTAWDASWYHRVALHGYPKHLPQSVNGGPAMNAWAFMPVYPYLAKALGTPFGSWAVGAIGLSLVAGCLSALVLYRILRMKLDASASMWATVFYIAGPLSALFEVAYAEALGQLLLMLILWGVMRRRYGWLFLLIPVFGFTRPGALPLALFLGVFGIWRIVRRRTELLRRGELVQIGALAVLATIVGFAWQQIAAIVTGDPNAYIDTELAWRRTWLVDATDSFGPFHGFTQGLRLWFTHWHLSSGLAIPAIIVIAAGAAALLLFEPHVRRLGVELRLWTASYLLYLLAVFFPQSSIFRLLLPVSPMWGAFAVSRSRGWRIGVLVVGLAAQWWWVFHMYGLGNSTWRIP